MIVLKMSALPECVDVASVGVCLGRTENVYDEIYVNKPSAIDHRLARSMQTFMHSG